MKHHLTFKDDKSDKFWQIEISGSSFTVTYGKTGAAGTSQVKNFSSEEECQQEAEKLLNEKLKKGYVAKEGGTSEYFALWESLVYATDRAAALKEHFILAGATERIHGVLDQFCESVTGVTINDGRLRLSLPWRYDGETVIVELNPPYVGPFNKDVPPSFRKLYSAHNGMQYMRDDDDFSWIIDGISKDGKFKGNGSWDPCCIEEGGNDEVILYLEQKEKSVDDVICFGSYDECQNWYVLHPKKKNSAGEPAIVLFNHGSCNFEDTSDHTFTDFIIKELARYILDITESPETTAPATRDLVSTDFYSFLRKTANVDGEEEEEGTDPLTRLADINWDKEAAKIYRDICQYWKKTADSALDAVGLFDIRWEDGENNRIEFDYEENNDLELAMLDGCIRNEGVIFFADLLSEIGLEEEYDDEQLEPIKQVLCKLAQELIVLSTASEEFRRIPKMTPFYIQFAYFHDDDARVIFDSSAAKQPSIYKKEEDIESDMVVMFMMADDIQTFTADAVALYNKNNENIRSGRYDESRRRILAFIDNYNDVEDGGEAIRKIEMKMPSGRVANFFESFLSDAVVFCVLAKDHNVFTEVQKVLPEKISDNVLAFNLACHASINRNKPELIKYTTMAVSLGKPKSDFLAESDFDFYKKDADFVKAIGG